MTLLAADWTMPEVPDIPESALVRDVPMKSSSGEILVTLMDGLEPAATTPLESFVTSRQPTSCTMFSAVVSRVVSALPSSFSMALTARGFQSCSGCFMTGYQLYCDGCIGFYWDAYSTGDCANCAWGLTQALWCNSSQWCMFYGVYGCNNSEYCCAGCS